MVLKLKVDNFVKLMDDGKVEPSKKDVAYGYTTVKAKVARDEFDITLREFLEQIKEKLCKERKASMAPIIPSYTSDPTVGPSISPRDIPSYEHTNDPVVPLVDPNARIFDAPIVACMIVQIKDGSSFSR